ncbi:MAG: UvrD-helicase domain-containing protein [Acidimicrobiales bacterium]
MLSEESLLEGLNPRQLEAVTHPGGPLLVIAGAGSGKTRVLTRRIAWLIAHEGISPFEILAITFTNKAADEMRRRVTELVGPVAERMWVSTFHSACVRILRRDATRLGYRQSFSIYDQADAVRLTSYVERDLGVDTKRLPPRSVHAAISAAKNEMVDFETFASRARTTVDRRIADVYREYQARLLAASAMDFDDLLVVAVNLLDSCPDVLEHYQTRFRHVLVDEFQDTNAAQNRLVMLLAAKHRNVAVVGDGDQAIFGFRGADVRNILGFEAAFPGAKVVPLEQNYRSTQVILDAANTVIANNSRRQPKSLWTDQRGGETVVRYHAEDERDEGAWLADEIRRLHGRPYEWGDMAVFYRTNAMSRAIEEELVRRDIPYVVVGGTRFYDRREVKDLLAYLRAVANPLDEVSLKRIVNVPKRGVGDTSLGRIDRYAANHGVGFGEALQHAGEAGVSGRALTGVGELLGILADLRALRDPPEAEEVEGEAGRMLDLVLERTGYLIELESERGVEAVGRIENVQELVGAARQSGRLEAFLEEVGLVADSDDLEGDTSNVVLMTLHTAKGLEYPVVFIVGMEDGVFPHMRSLGEPTELEEERRLAYVGITRARERLYLTHAWCRTLFGQTQYNSLSRFVKEIPDSLLRSEGRSPVRAQGVQAAREHMVESAMRRGRDHANSPVRGTGAAALGLRPGEQVFHAKWGEGTVTEINREGPEAEVTVRFPGLGEKRLLLSLAPLKRA